MSTEEPFISAEDAANLQALDSGNTQVPEGQQPPVEQGNEEFALFIDRTLGFIAVIGLKEGAKEKAQEFADLSSWLGLGKSASKVFNMPEMSPTTALVVSGFLFAVIVVMSRDDLRDYITKKINKIDEKTVEKKQSAGEKKDERMADKSTEVPELHGEEDSKSFVG